MNKIQRNFKISPIAAATAMVLATPFTAHHALAGSGFGAGVDLSNKPVAVPTFYANSPAGMVPALDPLTGAMTINPITGLPKMVGSGKALRKFVDPLPGIRGLSPATLGGKPFGSRADAIPMALPEKWVDPNNNLTTDDYYEIAAVEFTQRMHSDLPKATRLRGYVQLSTPKNPGRHIALRYPDGTAILDAAGAQVFAHDAPHHLGPVIKATKGVATRVKFTNYLPAGAGGNLFVPVDTTITGAGTGPDGVTYYTQNRAGVHLVGGQSPWISAGTPHQWVAPITEAVATAAGLGKGASTQNVPDMIDPGNGSVTLYFPNDMSARFTFMQDRTSGLTRLNSYAGLEAGYVVTDAEETKLITAGLIPADQIPLIIEDKTFVPGNVAQQDAKWTNPAWGTAGDLWFPHVYEPNQSPADITGANPVGRWDYGPLFWPIFIPPYGDSVLPDVSFTPEAFMDTPVINGTAYPTVTVDPKAYRLRILNASNDRFLNLSLFQADPLQQAPQLDLNGNPIVNAQGVAQVFSNTEVKMVPALGDAAGNPYLWGKDPAGVAVTDAAGNPVQFPKAKYPTIKSNITGEPSGPMRAWPVDNRIGGAPDPALAGPDFIVIGNDGGFLPNPVDVPAQPITYEANRRSITVGNVYGSGLLLGPAERSDAIVDFSQYAGKTLILYNDGPTPVPFNDPRNDYFTGDPDQTASGGTYSTKPGYGPNTRTMMQIVVNAAPAAPAPAPVAFDPTPLNTALPAAYAATQPAPIVPATAYNAAFKTNDTDIYAHVATGSAAQPNLVFSTTPGVGVVTLTKPTLVSSGAGNGSGSGYSAVTPPAVVFNNIVNGVNCLSAGGVSASATAVVSPVTHQVIDFANWTPGGPYTCAPTISFLSAASSLSGGLMTVTAGGSNYTNPTVSFNTNGGPGSGAAGAVTLASTVALTVTPGSGYFTAPTVNVAGAAYNAAGVQVPVTAIATVDLLGAITGVTLSQTTGFVTPPVFTIVDTTPALSGLGGNITAAIVPGTGVVAQIDVTNTGTGYTSAPTVVITDTAPGIGSGAAATVTLVNPATAGQLSQGGVGAQAVVNSTNMQSIPVLTKAEQELFDNYGRYNSTGGLELPLTNGVVQTTVPLNYIDTASETLGDSEVQIWKLVDNGLWTNAMHFNMVDVQLINRVGWDGTVKPPASNELGWRDTLRLNPLEDVILAVRAKRPAVPFGQPRSVRAMDPSKPLGVVNPPLVAPGGVRAVPLPNNLYASGLGFTNAPALVVPGTNTPLLSASNKSVSYDNEFVWGSSILGHSENDLQRPVVYSPIVVVPDAPTNLRDPLANGTWTWTDPTPAGIPSTTANPKNEIGFKIVAGTWNAAAASYTWAPYPNAAAQIKLPANKTSWVTTPADVGNIFAVVAYNAAGDSLPSTPFADAVPVAPANFMVVQPAAYNLVTLSWSAPALFNSTYQIFRNGAAVPLNAAPLAPQSLGYADATVLPNTAYSYTITASNQLGAATSGPVTVTTPMMPITAPTIVSALANATGTTVTLRWNDNATNETAYWVDVLNTTTGVKSVQVVIPRTGGQVAGTGAMSLPIATSPGNVYQITVTAFNALGGGSTSAAVTTTADLSAPLAPTAPVVTLGVKTATRAPLSWPAVAVPVTVPATTVNYVVQVQTNGGAWVSLLPTTALTTNAVIAAGNTYNFQVLAQATRFGLTTQSLASNLVPVTTPPAASTTPAAAAGAAGSKQITVTWTNPSQNITGFTVQRRLGAGAWANIAPAPVISLATAPAFTFTDTVPAGSYSYRLLATSAGGSTAYTAASNAVVAP